MTWMTLTGAGGGGAPSWLLRDPDTGGLPALDIDYAGNRAFKGSVVDLAGLHTVSRASGGYAENLDGSLTWFGNNVMRRTDRGVLVEGARTNLLLRSQEFENAAWFKVRCSSAANVTSAPDGSVTADSLIEDTTAANTHDLRSSVLTVSNGVAHTFSIFAKATGRTVIVLRNSGGMAYGARFNLATGVVEAAGASVAAAIRAYAGGWWRCSITYTSFSTSDQLFVGLTNGSYTETSIQSYNGDGTSGIFIWGAQLEAAAFASSYIPTGASTAARASDRVTLGPSFIGGEGTFVAETFGSAGNDANNGRIIGLGDPGQVAAINRTNAANTVHTWNGTQSMTATMGAGSWAGVVRAAIAFSPAGRAICGNAGGVATDAYALGDKTSLAVGSQSTGAFSFYGYIRRLTYFDRRISNAGLQALTA